ncbi:MAG: hypothetical protein KBT47_02635 [Armatimonadetes bacterium]|nr:hypothetical protein [Candidatus Hippobium faecium]
MGESGFFSSVMGQKELLAPPVRLGISVNGETLDMKKIPQTGTVKDTYVLFDTKLSDGKNSCDVRIKTDFDGFSTVKFRSEDINPEDIDKIYLDIPLAAHKDMYVHRVVSQTIQKLEGFGWSGKGDSSLWLGTHDMGIAYEADMPVFLSENMRKQIEIKENKEETLLRLNFVDGKGQVKDKGHIFRFYLTPTPTKNYSLDKTGLYHGMDLWFENWSDWQGYPDMNKVPEMKERNRKDEEEGRKLIIYFSQSLASDSPASLDFFTDLTAYPERGWYKRAYDPGKDVVCYVSCLRELYGDLLLDRIEKLMKETGVNSVYLDGPANPWECTNPTHNHCETNAEITWEDGDICPYEATRDFMKRLRGVLSESGKPFKIIAHTGGAIYPSTMSFCDGHYEGEQMARFRQGYRLPLSAFAIGYCGMPWGFRVDELPMKPVYSVEQIRTLALLHDSCVGDGPYGETGRVTEEKIYGDFQGADTEYFPYWEEQSYVKYKGKSLMSFYKNSDSAMIILGNLNYDTDKGVLDVSGLFGKNVFVFDVLNNKYINDSPETVNIEIKPWRYTALRIDKEKKETEDAEINNFINSEKYDIINSAEDFLCNKPCEKDGTSVKVKGIKYDTAAEISFAKSLGNEFYGEFQIERENILSICFGETVFTLYNGAWSAENMSFWNEGLFISGNFSEKQLNIKISVKDEKITILCNDRPVCVQVTANTGDRRISFRTWNDDTIKVIPLRLVSQYKELAEIIHPVR